MLDQPLIMKMAQDLARHAAARQALLAQNIANADTPGYRARDIPDFVTLYERLPETEMRRTRERHFVNEGEGLPRPQLRETAGEMSPDGNTVSLEEEMMRAVAVQREHDLALAIYRSGVTQLRAALRR